MPDISKLQESLLDGETAIGIWLVNWQANPSGSLKGKHWNIYVVPDRTHTVICQAEEVRLETNCNLVRYLEGGWLRVSGDLTYRPSREQSRSLAIISSGN